MAPERRTRMKAQKAALQISLDYRRNYYFKSIVTVAKSAVALWEDVDFVIENQQLLAPSACEQLRLFIESVHNWATFMMKEPLQELAANMRQHEGSSQWKGLDKSSTMQQVLDDADTKVRLVCNRIHRADLITQKWSMPKLELMNLEQNVPTYCPRELLLALVLFRAQPNFGHSLKTDPLKTLRNISTFTPFTTRPRRKFEYIGCFTSEQLRRYGPDGTPGMVFVLGHPGILDNHLIVGATAARFNRFPELHALARKLRDYRMEPIQQRVKDFHDNLTGLEKQHKSEVSSNPQAHGINTTDLKAQEVVDRIAVQARYMALYSMRNRSVGGKGGHGEAFLQDLASSAPPCYTCRGLWQWEVARISTQAELDATILSWDEETHGSVPHRCAETAAFLELELRENSL